jgi:hypothetical protein
MDELQLDASTSVAAGRLEVHRAAPQCAARRLIDVDYANE